MSESLLHLFRDISPSYFISTVVGINVMASPNPLAVFSVYFPCRSGCTDSFEEVMDSAFSLFPTAGNFNANPGITDGVCDCSIGLARYLGLCFCSLGNGPPFT